MSISVASSPASSTMRATSFGRSTTRPAIGPVLPVANASVYRPVRRGLRNRSSSDGVGNCHFGLTAAKKLCPEFAQHVGDVSLRFTPFICECPACCPMPLFNKRGNIRKHHEPRGLLAFVEAKIWYGTSSSRSAAHFNEEASIVM